MPFETLSNTKSRHILGRSLNIMDREETMLFAADKEQATTLRLLQKQAQVYHELCLVVRAIDALDNWRKIENEYTWQVPPQSLVSRGR